MHPGAQVDCTILRVLSGLPSPDSQAKFGTGDHADREKTKGEAPKEGRHDRGLAIWARGLSSYLMGHWKEAAEYCERAAEVLKRELPGQAAGVALPARDLASKPGDLRLWERWRPLRVLLAVLVDKLGNGRTVLVKGPNRLGMQPSSMRRRGGLRMPTANPRGFLRRLIAATRTGLRVPVGVRQH